MDELEKEITEWTSCSPIMRAAVQQTVEAVRGCNKDFLITDDDRKEHSLICDLTDADILQITQLFEEVLKNKKIQGEDEFQNILIQFIIYFISQRPSADL